MSNQKTWTDEFIPLRTKKELEGKELRVSSQAPQPSSRAGLFEMQLRIGALTEPAQFVRCLMTSRDITSVIDLLPDAFTFVPTVDGKWSNVDKWKP